MPRSAARHGCPGRLSRFFLSWPDPPPTAHVGSLTSWFIELESLLYP